MAADRRPATDRLAGQQPTGQQQPTDRPQLAAGKPAAAAAWRGRFYQGVLLAGNCREPAGDCHIVKLSRQNN